MKMTTIGCRIPKDYFVVTGAGQCNEGAGEDHWETGSYDLALEDAGIENFNIVKYSSVMPPEANEMNFDDAKKLFHHGAVLETIMASINGIRGDHLCAGVGRVKVEIDGELVGGFAAEYVGNASIQRAQELLRKDLAGIVKRRYAGRGWHMFDWKFNVRDLVVDEKFGTVLAAVCFITHEIPVI
jgi:arginine decarboxylase